MNMKSLETSTHSNYTSMTTTSYDDSDDELGAEIYRTSQTAKRHREEQQQATISSTQTATRRKSSQEEEALPLQLSVLDSKATSTANKKNTNKVIGSNKRKAAVLSTDDEICREVVTDNLKRVYRNGRYHRLCSSNGCTSIARGKEGVCTKHGAKQKLKTCSHKGCNNQVVKEGVCVRHGASWTKRICGHIGCNKYVQKEGVCTKHGAKVQKHTCSHKGCTNNVVKSGVCIRHGAKVVSRKTCSHEGCNSYARKDGVCIKHGAVIKAKKCSQKGCNNNARGKEVQQPSTERRSLL